LCKCLEPLQSETATPSKIQRGEDEPTSPLSETSSYLPIPVVPTNQRRMSGSEISVSKGTVMTATSNLEKLKISTDASVLSNKLSTVSEGEVSMVLEDLQRVTSRYHQHRLSELGLKKQKQLQPRLAAGLDQLGYSALQSSLILLSEEIEGLYYCLPFFSKPPTMKLLYTTHNHRRSLDELFSRTVKVTS
jgi:hypothetical protein